MLNTHKHFSKYTCTYVGMYTPFSFFFLLEKITQQIRKEVDMAMVMAKYSPKQVDMTVIRPGEMKMYK